MPLQLPQLCLWDKYDMFNIQTECADSTKHTVVRMAQCAIGDGGWGGGGGGGGVESPNPHLQLNLHSPSRSFLLGNLLLQALQLLGQNLQCSRRSHRPTCLAVCLCSSCLICPALIWYCCQQGAARQSSNPFCFKISFESEKYSYPWDEIWGQIGSWYFLGGQVSLTGFKSLKPCLLITDLHRKSHIGKRQNLPLIFVHGIACCLCLNQPCVNTVMIELECVRRSLTTELQRHAAERFTEASLWYFNISSLSSLVTTLAEPST